MIIPLSKRSLFYSLSHQWIVIFSTSIFLVLTGPILRASAPLLDNVIADNTTRYFARLTDGEVLIGTVVAIENDDDENRFMKFKTALGTATIYEKQLVELVSLDESYRHNNRIVFLPTADPIGKNHYIANQQLLLLNAGIGIGDIGSITLTRSIIPDIPADNQLTMLNAKATLYKAQNENMPGYVTVAAGGNFAWINTANPVHHLFVNATFTRVLSRVTAAVFYTMKSQDIFTVRAGTYGTFVTRYPSGGFGMALGLDTKLPGRQDLHILSELWNSDLSKPTNTAFGLGLRMANSAVALDFMIYVATAPAVIPAFTFTWTPL